MDNRTPGKKLLQNQVIRFVFSAGVGFLVDVTLFYLLSHNLDPEKRYQVLFFKVHNYQVFLSASFFSGVVVNFLFTRYLVFTESTIAFSKQFTRFISVAALGYFANEALMTFFIEALHFSPLAARVTSALSLFFASFFVHKFFSFGLALRHKQAGNTKRNNVDLPQVQHEKASSARERK